MIPLKTRFLAILFLLIPNWAAYAEPVAQSRLVVAIFDSFLPRENLAQANASLNELIELVGEMSLYRTQLRIIPGGTQKAFEDAAIAAERGEIHVLAITSIEYGWWHQMPNSQPEVIAVCDPGGQVNHYEELTVRAGSPFQHPRDLAGASLAISKRALPSSPIYLAQLRGRYGPEILSGKIHAVNSGADALHAVFDGECEVANVDVYTRVRFTKAFPGRGKQLAVIDRSTPFPLPVVAGSRDHIERLQAGLWNRLQASLYRLHESPKSAAFLEVWALRAFIKAPSDYNRLAQKAAAAYPFTELPAGR